MTKDIKKEKPKSFNHEEEDTHYVCDDRFKAMGGEAECCECYPHKDCKIVVRELNENIVSKEKWEEVDWWEEFGLVDDIDGAFDGELIVKLKTFIKKEKEKSKLEGLDIVDNLIAKEIVIAQKEGEKTSRLTSLSVTLKKEITK